MAFLHGIEVLVGEGGARPIRTVRTGVIGIVGTAPLADATVFPINTPVLVAADRAKAAKLNAGGEGDAGTLPAALEGIFDQIGAVVVVVRVEKDADDAETMANVIGGVDGATGQLQGVHALIGAESVLGVEPKILIAPGFTHQRPDDGSGGFLANPVIAELEVAALAVEGVVVADGPNTTDAAALAHAADFGANGLTYFVDPWFKVMRPDGTIAVEPPSARVAGSGARTDDEVGYWRSWSNRPINGIIGLSRAIDFRLGDPNSRANLLNEGNVATVIRKDGYRLWGNRVPTSDPKWQFLPVLRTRQAITEALMASLLWAVDRGITKTFAEDVSDSVNGFLASEVARGAILGGTCIPNPDLNTAATVAKGEVYFDIDFTPVYPAERIVFRLRSVDTYVEEVLV